MPHDGKRESNMTDKLYYTENYNLATLPDDCDDISFKAFRQLLMGDENGNMTKIDKSLAEKEDVENKAMSITENTASNAYPSVSALKSYVAVPVAAFSEKSAVALAASGTLRETGDSVLITELSDDDAQKLKNYAKNSELITSAVLKITANGKSTYTGDATIELEDDSVKIKVFDSPSLTVNKNGILTARGLSKLGFEMGDAVSIRLQISFPQIDSAFLGTLSKNSSYSHISLNKLGDTTTLTVSDIYGEQSVKIHDGVSLTPGFADSTDQCTDTERLYMLPDGYIYAYLSDDTPAYTNLLTKAEGGRRQLVRHARIY